jgi:uncharacterized protein HemY
MLHLMDAGWDEPADVDAETLWQFGRLLEGRQRWGLAETQYRRALESDPSFAPARTSLANLLRGQGRADEADAVERSE